MEGGTEEWNGKDGKEEGGGGEGRRRERKGMKEQDGYKYLTEKIAREGD